MHAPTVRPFGILPDGRAVSLYTLEVPGGWRAEITDYGAILTSFHVPVGRGSRSMSCSVRHARRLSRRASLLGATCGRVANRIAGGTFELDGKRYTLATNNGANHLHGGVAGFDKKLWKATPRISDRGPAVDFEVVSPAGDEGYPGTAHGPRHLHAHARRRTVGRDVGHDRLADDRQHGPSLLLESGRPGLGHDPRP